jgi:hypothetical protein
MQMKIIGRFAKGLTKAKKECLLSLMFRYVQSLN